MPLIKSASDEARNKNIAEMIHSGHAPKQAEAASYANQREMERKEHEHHKYGR
jgi:hypothetical protein